MPPHAGPTSAFGNVPRILRSFVRTVLPLPARTALAKRYYNAVAPRPGPVESIRPGEVVVAGFLSTASGIGQSARTCLRAFTELGCSPACLDLSGRFANDDIPAPAGRAPSLEPGGTLILHANPPEVSRCMAALGRRLIRDRRMIGFWAWELPSFPMGWERAFRFFHEIWVPSRFVADALAPRSPVPLRVVPHPLFPGAAPEGGRARFGLPDEVFVVLTMFDMRSSMARKNPLGAIDAFRRAFGDDPDRLLLVKASNTDAAPNRMAELAAAVGETSNVRLSTEVLDATALAALMACCDVLLSVHRAEGFGFPLAEAMALATPVIATNWSANTEFMTADSAALVDFRLAPVRDTQGIYAESGTTWAEPDLDHAASWLVRLAGDRQLVADLGRRGREQVMRALNLDAYRRRVAHVANNWRTRMASRPVRHSR